jgi:hypothetical protein
MATDEARDAIEHVNAVIQFLQKDPDLNAVVEGRGPLRIFLKHLKFLVDEALGYSTP